MSVMKLDPTASTELGARASRSATLASRAYEQIRRDIVRVALAPGQKLHLEQLRERYQVGLSPLREALSRLASDRLVVSEDQRGFRVAPVSTEDMIDLTRLRQKLESMALRMAIEQGDDDWEADLVSAWHRLSKASLRDAKEPRYLNDDWEVRHREFHRALVSACGSPRLLHLRDLLYDQSDRYRRLAVAVQGGDRDIFREHKDVFDATIERDAETACERLEAHLDLTAKIVLQAQDEPDSQRRG